MVEQRFLQFLMRKMNEKLLDIEESGTNEEIDVHVRDLRDYMSELKELLKVNDQQSQRPTHLLSEAFNALGGMNVGA